MLTLVRIGDTLERDPTHICDPKPKEVIVKFMEELESCGKNIGAVVRAEFVPQDIALVSGEQRRVIVEWCRQVPVLPFNCRRYDLNLIKEHFAELLANKTGKVQVGEKKMNTTVLMKTNDFRSVDLIWARAPATKTR